LCVAREKQHKRTGDSSASSNPLAGMFGACKGMPAAFYTLIFVQCMVWLGNTFWGSYGKEWFTHSVFPGDAEAPEGSFGREMYIAGADAFASAGQWGSLFNLSLSFGFMGLGYTSIPNNFIYAPCLFLAAAVCFTCAFVVGNSHGLAVVCFILSSVGMTAAGSIPYGIVAVWNKAAATSSVAMQMAILNCCITVGQQLCTMILGGLEVSLSLPDALRGMLIISMVANGLGGVGAFFLTGGTDTSGGKSVKSTSSSESENDESEESSGTE